MLSLPLYSCTFLNGLEVLAQPLSYWPQPSSCLTGTPELLFSSWLGMDPISTPTAAITHLVPVRNTKKLLGWGENLICLESMTNGKTQLALKLAKYLGNWAACLKSRKKRWKGTATGESGRGTGELSKVDSSFLPHWPHASTLLEKQQLFCLWAEDLLGAGIHDSNV